MRTDGVTWADVLKTHQKGCSRGCIVRPEVKNASHKCLDRADKAVACRGLTNNFATDTILLINECSRPKTSLSQFGRGQSLQVVVARSNEELDVLEAKWGFVISGVLPRPKKEEESQNDHIGCCLVKKSHSWMIVVTRMLHVG